MRRWMWTFGVMLVVVLLASPMEGVLAQDASPVSLDDTPSPEPPLSEADRPSLTINGSTDNAIAVSPEAMVTIVWSGIPFLAVWSNADCAGLPADYTSGGSGTASQSAAVWVAWAGGPSFSVQGFATQPAAADQELSSCRTITIADAPAVAQAATATPELTIAAAPRDDDGLDEPSLLLNGSDSPAITLADSDPLTIAGTSIPLILVYAGSACVDTPTSVFPWGTTSVTQSGEAWSLAAGLSLVFSVQGWSGTPGQGNLPITTCRIITLDQTPTTQTPEATATPTGTVPTATVVPPSLTLNGSESPSVALQGTDPLTISGTGIPLLLAYVGANCTGDPYTFYPWGTASVTLTGSEWSEAAALSSTFSMQGWSGAPGQANQAITSCRTIILDQSAPEATATMTPIATTPGAPPASTTTETPPTIAAPSTIVPTTVPTNPVNTLPNTGSGEETPGIWPMLLLLAGVMASLGILVGTRARRR